MPSNVDTLSLDQILAYVPITGLMYETSMGLPDPLPESFRNTTREVVGDAARLMVRRGMRRLAKRVEYGSQARARNMVSIGYKDMKMIHFFEVESVNPNVLFKLRDTTNYTNQTHGREELTEQAKQFAQLFMNTEIVSRQLVLSKGVLYFDVDGTLLPSSSGAVYTFDFNIPANNKNQLNGIISAPWSSAGTDIVTQIIKLKKQSIRDTGLDLKYAFYTENIVNYFAANTTIQQYLARHPVMRDQFLSGAEIPDGLLGLTWVPVYKGFWEDDTGTNQDIWAADAVTFTPDPAIGDWWRMQKGSIMVPRSLQVSEAGAGVLDNAEIRYGMGGYGAVNLNPIKLDMYYFHTFLPTIQNEKAVYLADVTP